MKARRLSVREMQALERGVCTCLGFASSLFRDFGSWGLGF